jgi:hypothetical protein
MYSARLYGNSPHLIVSSCPGALSANFPPNADFSLSPPGPFHTRWPGRRPRTLRGEGRAREATGRAGTRQRRSHRVQRPRVPARAVHGQMSAGGGSPGLPCPAGPGSRPVQMQAATVANADAVRLSTGSSKVDSLLGGGDCRPLVRGTCCAGTGLCPVYGRPSPAVFCPRGAARAQTRAAGTH